MNAILCNQELNEITIDARQVNYRDLNKRIRQYLTDGVSTLTLEGVNGQRYIGDGITGHLQLVVNGIPGNDLGAFMNGPEIIVNSNAQDAVGNSMNRGKIIVNGNAGDTLGYAMRGGQIFVKGNVGYRVGIHMKEYKETIPVLVIGGTAGDFFGEYMAGGRMILLGLNTNNENLIVGNFCGTGMHGGIIYIRGKVEEDKIGKEVKIVETTQEDMTFLNKYVDKFSKYFGYRKDDIMKESFSKLIPFNKRPYGNLYAAW